MNAFALAPDSAPDEVSPLEERVYDPNGDEAISTGDESSGRRNDGRHEGRVWIERVLKKLSLGMTSPEFILSFNLSETTTRRQVLLRRRLQSYREPSSVSTV